MLISQMINQLEALKGTHGDMQIETCDRHGCSTREIMFYLTEDTFGDEPSYISMVGLHPKDEGCEA